MLKNKFDVSATLTSAHWIEKDGDLLLSHSSWRMLSYSILCRFNVPFIPLSDLMQSSTLGVYAFGNYQISRIISGNSFNKKVCIWQYAKVVAEIFHYTFISFLPHQGTKSDRRVFPTQLISIERKQHLLSAGAQHFYTTIHFFPAAGGVKETEADFHVFGAN